MARQVAPAHARTPAQLAAAIRKLPPAPPIVIPGVWYQTQKQHWLGWLSEYGGPGAYGRKNYKYDARFTYNHIVEPKMLMWLIEASQVPRIHAKRAKRAQRALAGKSLSAQAAAIRKCVPWEQIEKVLWGLIALARFVVRRLWGGVVFGDGGR